ncbi:MAG: hypothetical protein BRC38_05465 [Cyanobacteria bacterium QH_6_48_35]|nr:MAG: hypothetical protein BRC34_10665 [Cyanobacteria bacterium QH_1_48_107]PSO66549.1 MAG: hypothetical protein BRC38_05465 [Cyanobacteria bacterium QH_6_48_35]PSO67116.1 MAG: hypothetical protein BRC42_16810 [Cyanobacteria bacterium QS_1_48_34]
MVDNPASKILTSNLEVDYTPLRHLLAAGKWREANQQTHKVMLKAVGKLNPESINTLPCSDLHAIDRLWQHYSQGRFGFSAQKTIYLKSGNQPGQDYNWEAFKRFGDHIGWRKEGSWRKHEELTFSLNAPAGHLPVVKEAIEVEEEVVIWAEVAVACSALFSRATDCGL